MDRRPGAQSNYRKPFNSTATSGNTSCSVLRSPEGRGGDPKPDPREPAALAVSTAAEHVKLGSQTRKHLRNKLHSARKAALQYKSQVFLELFSGSGEISRQLRRQGFGVVSLDTRHSELKICAMRSWLSPRCVARGTQCTLWSVAHTTPIVRTKKYILGVPGPTGKHKQPVLLGNATAAASAKIITACTHSRVPAFRENPSTSKLFLAPCIHALRQHPDCSEFTSDLCQYGASWKKAIKVHLAQCVGGSFKAMRLAGALKASAGLRLQISCMGQGMGNCCYRQPHEPHCMPPGCHL